MSDNRLGINVNVSGVSQSEAEFNRLRTTIGTLRDAIANLGRSNMGGSNSLANSLATQLQTAEAKLKTFQAQLISTYSSADTFSIRAIAAMRGQADAIKGVARELTALDNISRSRGSGNIWNSTIQDAIASKINSATASSAAEHAKQQRDLENTFRYGATSSSSAVGAAVAKSNIETIEKLRQANVRAAGASAVAWKTASVETINDMLGIGRSAGVTEEEVTAAFRRMGRSAALAGEEAGGGFWSRFMRGGRTPISLIDEGMRGQRGAMMATLGAGLKSADAGGVGVAAGIGGIVALVGTGAILKAAEQLGKLNEQIKAGSEAVGMSVHQYAQIQGALILVGDKAEAADAMIRHFATSVEKATANPKSEQAKAFDSAKIFPDELKAKGADTFAMLQRVSQALKQFADDGTKAAFLTEVFGRNDVAVVKLMQDFDELTGRSDKYADSVDKNIDTATRMNDSLNELSLSWHTLMEDAAEPLNFVVNFVITGFDAVKSAIGAINRGMVAFGQFDADPTGLGAGFGGYGGAGSGDVPSTTLPEVGVDAKKTSPMQPFSKGGGGGSSHPMFKEQEADIANLRQQLSGLRADYQLYSEQIDASSEHQKIQSRIQRGDRDISPLQQAKQDYSTAQASAMSKIAALQALAGKSAAIYAQMASDAKKQYDEDEAAFASGVKNKEEALNKLTAAQKEYNNIIGEGSKAQTEFQVQIQKIQNQADQQAVEIVNAHKQAVDKVINEWGGAFDKIGDQLEDTIVNAIKSAFIPQKPEYSWTSSTGPGGIPLMHAHRINPTLQMFSGLATSAGTDLGKELGSSVLGSISKDIFPGASSFGDGLAKMMGFGTPGGFLGTGLGAVKALSGIGGDATKVTQEAAVLANTTALATLTTALAANTTAVSTSAAAATTSAGGSALSAAGSAGGFFSGLKMIAGILPLPIFSSGGVVPAAAGGWALPRNFGTDSILSALTPGETVLPASERPSQISKALQGGQAGGDMHLHFHGPADAPSIARWFKENMRNNSDAVRQMFRQNQLTPRSL